MLPSSINNRSSILWGLPGDPHRSITQLHAQEARLSNPRYMNGEPTGSTRHSNRRYVEEDSADSARYSNFRYVDREARSSNYIGSHDVDAESEASEEDQSPVEDWDFNDSTSSNQIIIPEIEDIDNLVVPPVKGGTPKVTPPDCELCQKPIERLDVTSSLMAVFYPHETSTASSSRKFTCGHRVHSTCYDASREVWDAETAICPVCGEPFLHVTETAMLADTEGRRDQSSDDFADDTAAVSLQPAEPERPIVPTSTNEDVEAELTRLLDGVQGTLGAANRALGGLKADTAEARGVSNEWHDEDEDEEATGKPRSESRSEKRKGSKAPEDQVSQKLLRGDSLYGDEHEVRQQDHARGSTGQKPPNPIQQPPTPTVPFSLQSLFKESHSPGNKSKKTNEVTVLSQLNDDDNAATHQQDEKSFDAIRQALTEACKFTCEACDLLLAPIQKHGIASDFTTLYLALLIRDLLGVTTTLQDMLRRPFSQIRGENEAIFFTLCRRYFQAFVTLSNALRDRGDLKSEYIAALRPVQRSSKRAAGLIASSRWSTTGGSILPWDE